MFIYYDSRTGNVQRFIDKIANERPLWKYIKISENLKIENPGHLITYTTNIGEIPLISENFLEYDDNRNKIKSLSSSGNMNWGKFYAVAADKLSEKYRIPILMKFELSGNHIDVANIINKIETFE